MHHKLFNPLFILLEYTNWSEYSACSATCGDGKKVRIRNCIYGDCNKPLKEEIECKVQNCGM